MTREIPMQSTPSRSAEYASLADYLRGALTPSQRERPLLVSFTQWDFAVGAVGEAVMTLYDMGSDVSLALWADETPLRDVGWCVNHRIASLLRSPTIDQRLKSALRAAGIPKEILVDVRRPWLPHEPPLSVSHRYRSALRAMTYRGAPLGRGVLEVPPHPDVPVTDDFNWPAAYVDKAVESYTFVFDQACRVMQERKITSVFVYNGRFLHDSAVAAAARANGLPVLFYDTGGLETDFDLTIDDTHDWSALQRRMQHMFDTWPSDTRDVVAGAWFTDRIEHTESANARFTGDQCKGQGIERTDEEVVVTYFSSSGDEIVELDLDWATFFGGQEGAVLAVAQACRSLGYRLVVRTHPHKRFKSERDVRDWHDAVRHASPDVHLDEHSDVDSYTLMRQSDVVVTFGSSTGVEAGFLERPVVVMGPSAYDELGCAVRVRTQEELIHALHEKRAGAQANALPYGLMMKRRGFVYEFLTRNADGTRSLAGVAIVEPRPAVKHLSHAAHRFTRWRLTRR